jgi:hypothetical protein
MELLKFRMKVPPAPPPRDPDAPKFGLYPLGEEILMSAPAFEVIVYMLRNGTPEDREELAAVLKRMRDAPFRGAVPVGMAVE